MTSERLHALEAEVDEGRPIGTADPGGRGAGEDDLVVTPDALGFRPHNCFACGELNAAGLHLRLHLEPGRCWTDLAIPARFEGWEGVIHGGILCTILDEVMAWSLVEQDSWGVTARMNVDFRRPVVVDQAIRAEGWITENRRRVQRTRGRIVDAATGQELVSTEATYVAAPESKKEELKRRYGFRALLVRPAAAGPDLAPSAPRTASALEDER